MNSRGRCLCFAAVLACSHAGSEASGGPPGPDAQVPPAQTHPSNHAAEDATSEAHADASSAGSSELRIVARADPGSRLHMLLDGTILLGHGLTMHRLDPGRAPSRVLAVRPPEGFDPEGTRIGTVEGASVRELWFTLVEAHPGGHVAPAYVAQAGDARPAPMPSFYRNLRQWKKGALLALRAASPTASATPRPRMELTIVGDGGPAPSLPAGFSPTAFASFDSGQVLAIGVLTAGDAPAATEEGGTVFRLESDGRASLERLPDEPELLSAVASRGPRDLYVAGTARAPGPRGYVAHWDGAKWTHEPTLELPAVAKLAVGSDGRLWAVTVETRPSSRDAGATAPHRGELWSRPAGGVFARVPLPPAARREARDELLYRAFKHGATTLEPEGPRKLDAAGDAAYGDDQTPVEAVDVVARGPNEVWVDAVDAQGRGQATYLLYATATTHGDTPTLVDLEAEDQSQALQSENEKPPGPATASCATTFVSLGAPGEALLSRIRATLSEKDSPVPALTYLTGRLHGEAVVGVYFGRGEGTLAQAFVRDWQRRGVAPSAYCARPVPEDAVRQ